MKEKNKIKIIEILCIISLIITIFSIQRTYARYFEQIADIISVIPFIASLSAQMQNTLYKSTFSPIQFEPHSPRRGLLLYLCIGNISNQSELVYIKHRDTKFCNCVEHQECPRPIRPAVGPGCPQRTG